MPYTRQLSAWGITDHFTRPPDQVLFAMWDNQLAALTGGIYNVKEYGALAAGPGGQSADQAAFTNAINDCNASPYGGVVTIPPGDGYYLFGALPEPLPRTKIVGAGSAQVTLNHTGNNSCFSSFTSQAGVRKRFQGFTLLGPGPGNASAIGLDLGNHTLGTIEDVQIQTYSAGDAIRHGNYLVGGSAKFSEEWVHRDVRMAGNLRNFTYYRNGGTDSFSSHRFQNVYIGANIANSKGIAFGTETFGNVASGTCNLYSGELNMKIMPEATGAVAMDVGAGSDIQDSEWNLTIENSTAGAVTTTGIRTASGTLLHGAGRVYLVGNAGSINHSIGSGSSVRIDHASNSGYATRDGAVDVTLDPHYDALVQDWNASFATVGRLCVLGVDKGLPGDRFKIRRSGGGVGTLIVRSNIVGGGTQDLYTFPASTNGACEVVLGRLQWQLVGNPPNS